MVAKDDIRRGQISELPLVSMILTVFLAEASEEFFAVHGDGRHFDFVIGRC